MTTRPIRPVLGAAMAAACALALGGCVSLGAEVPDTLLTLAPDEIAPIGMSAAAGEDNAAGAIAVLTPEVPAKLDVLRLPVNVTETQIAYLREAFWVEKPARLFRRLIGETLRVRASAGFGQGEGEAPLILDSEEAGPGIGVTVRGTLSELSYDAPSSSVVVRFDAVRLDSSGTAKTRRFEARESGVIDEASAIGPALNRAANQVAREVADWVLAQ